MTRPSAPVTPGAQSRAAAARVVDRVLSHGQTLDDALAAELTGALPAREQSRVRALAFGSVRWYHRYELIIGQLLKRPLHRRDRILNALLAVGLYQLSEPRQPGYAAVSATVGATRLIGQARAAGLVNALLRRAQREAGLLQAAACAQEQGRYSHPQWLIDRLRADWPDDYRQLLEAAQAHPPLWLRINRARTTPALWQALPEAPASSAVPFFPDALKVTEPVPVEQLPGFAEGLVSVQDAAAQLAGPLLDAKPGMRVLDACAAPGGKAAHLLEAAAGQLKLTALDISPSRLASLHTAMLRLGLSARLCAGDACEPAGWWDGAAFDRILLDAPCSGSGVIRRHPDIKLLRRPGDLAAMIVRQRSMLDSLWPVLKPGGRLLYVTCSILREENELLIADFLSGTKDAAVLALGLPAADLLRPAANGIGCYLLPGVEDTDGFYYVLIERRAEPAQAPA